MQKKQTVSIGKQAPDFTIDDQNEKPFKLSDFKGKKILLSFHPLAWTSVCAQQMKTLEENTKIFEKNNTLAVGVSVDSVPSKKAWAKELGVNHTRFLSDFWPHGKVAQQYGIFRDEDGISERANVIIDEEQKISFIKIYPISQLPDIEEIIRFVEHKQVTKTI
ncbi:MAG: peroxiredoxin [Methanobacteriota archaeon]